MQNKIREENVSVLLSEILQETGVTNISLLNLGGIPDIYLLIRGVRVVVEIKEEGNSAALQKQLEGRLEKNICDLGVGLEYPSSIVTGKLSPPTTKEVRKRLMSELLRARGLAHGATGCRVVFQDSYVRAPELPELLASIAGEVMPAAEIESVITKVRETIMDFAKGISTLPNVDFLAKSIMEELELGKE